MSSPLPSRWRVLFQGRRKWISIPLLLALAGLLVFSPLENWRGRNAWEATKAELIAKGETFDLNSFKLPAVPDTENRMRHPFALRHLYPDGQRLRLIHPVMPGLTGAPYSLGDLRPLSFHSVTNHSVREQIQALALTNLSGLETQAIVMSRSPLSDVLKTLFRAAHVNALFEEPDVTLRDKWGRVINLDVPETKTTPVDLLDDLLTQYGMVTRYNPTNQLFVIAPLRASVSDILNALKPFDAEIADFDDVLLRPKAVAWQPLDLESSSPVQGYVNLRLIAQCCATRARISALQGDREGMLRDLHRIRGAADCSLGLQPSIIVCAMIHSGLAGMLASTVEELLAAGLIAPADCAQVQREVEGLDLVAALRSGLRAERIQGIQWLEHYRHDPPLLLARIDQFTGRSRPGGTGLTSPSAITEFRNELFRWLGRAPVDRYDFLAAIAPTGWVDQNCALIIRRQQTAIDCLDTEAQRVHARHFDAMQKEIWDHFEDPPRPYDFLASRLTVNFVRALKSAARNQTVLNEAAIACALERFRAAQGHYPDALTELVPNFITRLPHDLFDGQPLRYRRMPGQTLLLYSIAWDSHDDGGTVARRNPKQPNSKDADPDWTWGK